MAQNQAGITRIGICQILVLPESLLRRRAISYRRLSQKIPKNRQMPVMRVMAEDVGQMQRACNLRLPANQQVQATLLQPRNGSVQTLKSP